MPPIVARFDVEISGANSRPWGLSARFSSSSTHPGSTRAQRSSALISSTRSKCFEQSRITPGTDRLAGLRRPAAPGRDRHPEPGADRRRRPTTSAAVAGKRDHQRNDLIDAGVRRVERPAEPIEPHVVRADRLGQGLVAALVRSMAWRLRPVDHGQFGQAHVDLPSHSGRQSRGAPRGAGPARGRASRRPRRTRRARVPSPPGP